jgi:hypothetical protein
MSSFRTSVTIACLLAFPPAMTASAAMATQPVSKRRAPRIAAGQDQERKSLRAVSGGRAPCLSILRRPIRCRRKTTLRTSAGRPYAAPRYLSARGRACARDGLFSAKPIGARRSGHPRLASLHYDIAGSAAWRVSLWTRGGHHRSSNGFGAPRSDQGARWACVCISRLSFRALQVANGIQSAAVSATQESLDRRGCPLLCALLGEGSGSKMNDRRA